MLLWLQTSRPSLWRSLPPCGGGTGRGVDARTELCLLLLRCRVITRQVSPNLFCPRFTSIAAFAATPLPVPPPQGGRERQNKTPNEMRRSLLPCSRRLAHSAHRQP